MQPKPYQNASVLTLPDLDLIAKQTLLVQRESEKFTPSSFLMTLIKSAGNGKASLNEMAINLGKTMKPMSRQALHERLTPKSTAFLISVLHELMSQRLNPVREVLKNADLSRVLIEDSTTLVMPKKNAETFPAHGNAYGNTAGLKIDLAYDLLSGAVTSHTIEKATEQDKVIGKEALLPVERGDLVMRDMGYFDLSEFSYLEGLGAHWLTRLPMNCGVFGLNGKTLESLLENTTEMTLDIPVKAGNKGPYCRLIAIRVDQEIVDKRRRERREKAKKSGKIPRKNGLIRDGWHLMLTSLSPEQASAEELATLYTARWSIELQFRGLKKSFNLKHALNRITNEYHHFALILAAMIAHQLTTKLWNMYHRALAQKKKVLSLEKLLSAVSDYLSEMKLLEEIRHFEPDFRHITYDQRNRKPLINQAFRPLA